MTGSADLGPPPYETHVVASSMLLAALPSIHPNAGIAWDLVDFASASEHFLVSRIARPYGDLALGSVTPVKRDRTAILEDQGSIARLFADPEAPLGVRWKLVAISRGVNFLAHPPGFPSREAYEEHRARATEAAREAARIDQERRAAIAERQAEHNARLMREREAAYRQDPEFQNEVRRRRVARKILEAEQRIRGLRRDRGTR